MKVVNIYRSPIVIAKMVEGKIKNLTEDELNRVFNNCVSPQACKRAVYKMLDSGLTLQEVYQK